MRSSRNRFLRGAYQAFYKLHLWVAVQLGKRFAGTRAVYLTSGMSTGDVHIGISDVDIAIYGDWPEKKQFRLMQTFGLLTVISPLFDRMSIPSIGTMDDLRILCATDMSLALTHARGARGWKLLYGEPVLATLPEIAPERFAGCVYMDIRRWWSSLAGISFGDSIVARDPIFRNSISFKAAAETLRAERMLHSGISTTRRGVLIEEELARHSEPTLRMLQNSATEQYLEIEHDPRGPMLHWFLNRAERFHDELRTKPSFDVSTRVNVTGVADERSIGTRTMEHAQQLVELAKKEWPGLLAAFLVPSISMFSPDSLSLLLEVGAKDVPSLELLQRLCARHGAASSSLPQRLGIYLLLPNAAYQLDIRGSLEFFHYTYLPEANPDVYAALSRPEYLLHGQPRSAMAPLGWSPFAQELVLEELLARRGAYQRFGLTSRPTEVENLRNFWRFLQLIAIEHSQMEGKVTLPTTIASICHSLTDWLPQSQADLQSLKDIYNLVFAGGNQDAHHIASIIQRLYNAILEAV